MIHVATETELDHLLWKLCVCSFVDCKLNHIMASRKQHFRIRCSSLNVHVFLCKHVGRTEIMGSLVVWFQSRSHLRCWGEDHIKSIKNRAQIYQKLNQNLSNMEPKSIKNHENGWLEALLDHLWHIHGPKVVPASILGRFGEAFCLHFGGNFREKTDFRPSIPSAIDFGIKQPKIP